VREKGGGVGEVGRGRRRVREASGEGGHGSAEEEGGGGVEGEAGDAVLWGGG
jgi:hypothetical protein